MPGRALLSSRHPSEALSVTGSHQPALRRAAPLARLPSRLAAQLAPFELVRRFLEPKATAAPTPGSLLTSYLAIRLRARCQTCAWPRKPHQALCYVTQPAGTQQAQTPSAWRLSRPSAPLMCFVMLMCCHPERNAWSGGAYVILSVHSARLQVLQAAAQPAATSAPRPAAQLLWYRSAQAFRRADAASCAHGWPQD